MVTDDHVVCTACRTQYAFPLKGDASGCPTCGSLSWVVARLARATPPDARTASGAARRGA